MDLFLCGQSTGLALGCGLQGVLTGGLTGGLGNSLGGLGAMSASTWSRTIRPSVDSATRSNEVLEKQGLETIKRKREGGASKNECDDLIDNMCDDAKERNEKNIDNMRKKMKDIEVPSDKKQEFKTWIQDDVHPLIGGLVTALKEIGNLLVSAARAVVNFVVSAAKSIGNFIRDRARNVANFFRSWF